MREIGGLEGNRPQPTEGVKPSQSPTQTGIPTKTARVAKKAPSSRKEDEGRPVGDWMIIVDPHFGKSNNYLDFSCGYLAMESSTTLILAVLTGTQMTPILTRLKPWERATSPVPPRHIGSLGWDK